jgi:predicted HAD superfamily Cof-like phosphohydrolase
MSIFSHLFGKGAPAFGESAAVHEFTEAAGTFVPSGPVPMSEDRVRFVSKMIVDEVLELMATIYTPEEAKQFLRETVDLAKECEKEEYEPTEEGQLRQMGDQADALVDVIYYSHNAAVKSGMNLSAVFGLVHAANMAKRNPETGDFLRREDGKVLKPGGWWVPPDIAAEMGRQKMSGSW